MDITTILQAANIPEDRQADCYISDDGTIFTPLEDMQGVLIRTAKECYEAWTYAKEHLAPLPKSELEILQETVDMLVLSGLGV